MKPINEIDKQFKTELIQSEYEFIAFLLNKTTQKSDKWTKIKSTTDLSSYSLLSNSDDIEISTKVIRVPKPRTPNPVKNRIIHLSTSTTFDSENNKIVHPPASRTPEPGKFKVHLPTEKVENHQISPHAKFHKKNSIPEKHKVDFSNFCIHLRRVTCRLFLNIASNNNIRTILGKCLNNSDIIIYDGAMMLEKYNEFDPSKYLCKIPGLVNVCKKKNFFKSLYEMKKKYPEKYECFIPITFQLPEEEKQFQQFSEKTKSEDQKWVLKKNNSGKKGITFIQKVNELENFHYESIIQQFISPYLIQGHKFDLRIYIIITNLEPLTLYIYNECIAYFCQEPYTTPSVNNRNSYSFQKNQIITNTKANNNKIEPVQYARSIIRRISHNNGDLWNKIKEIASLSIISIYEEMKKCANEACDKNDTKYPTKTEKINPLNRFMNVIGLDILIEDTGEPFVIGINDNPGMKPINEIDKQFKTELIQSEYEFIAFLLGKTHFDCIKWTQILPSIKPSIKGIVQELSGTNKT